VGIGVPTPLKNNPFSNQKIVQAPPLFFENPLFFVNFKNPQPLSLKEFTNLLKN